MLGDKLRQLISDEYVSYFVIAASSKMLNERVGDLKKFLEALVEADKLLKKNPSAAQVELVKAAQGSLTANAVKTSWPEYKYDLGLDQGLLDTMYSEARSIQSKNIMKDAKADKAVLRKYIVDGPLRSIAPNLVELPPSP